MMNVRRVVLLSLLGAAAGCADQSALLTPDTPLEAAAPRPPADAPVQPSDRANTPWRRMADDQLAAEVSRAGGRVFIGFKEPGAQAGVDARGRQMATEATVRAAKAELRARGIPFRWESRTLPYVVAEIPATAVRALRANPRVEYVEPILPGKWSAQPIPWNIDRVQAPPAWPFSTGSGVKLLIIDSGTYWGHRDLAMNGAWRCINSSLPVDDQYGHGTHVAGIAAALNNDVDVVGVAPGVQLWSANVEINGAPDAAEAACSVEVGRINGMFSMNMSFEVLPYTALTDQIKAGYYQTGVFFAASAGNGYCSPVTYPANLSEVVAVAATTSGNTRAIYSNCGPEVELSAPGDNILSTALPWGVACASGGLTAYCSGTSMASPHVAGAAAVIKSYNPAYSNVDVRNRLRATAIPLGSATEYGYGLIQVRNAL